MKTTSSMTHLVLGCFLLLLACSSTGVKDAPVKLDTAAERANVLIVYLSRTSNTKAVAGIIQDKVGGELVALELETPYPQNYRATVQQVAEENERGYLPPLRTRIDSLEKYDVVFVGFPTWGMQLPPPVKSFLHQYDLSGKTVIPFNTHGGYGVGSSFRTVKELCPRSRVLEGFSTRGGSERDGQYLVIKDEKKREVEKEVERWLEKIGMLRPLKSRKQ